MRAKLHELQRASQHEKKERQKYSGEIGALKRSLSREKEITKKLKLDQVKQANETEALKAELASKDQSFNELKQKHEIQTGKFEAFKAEVAQEKEKSEQQRAQMAQQFQELKRQMELLMANQNVKDLALNQLDTQHGSLDVKCTGLRVDVDKLDMRSHRQENDLHHVANCVEG